MPLLEIAFPAVGAPPEAVEMAATIQQPPAVVCSDQSLGRGAYHVSSTPPWQAFPIQFVLTRKRDGCYKARLVAGGHRQRLGIDCQDTFATV
jgi:hypothetical protein